jgi:Flp pilus assembly protein RcpC/CpaB
VQRRFLIIFLAAALALLSGVAVLAYASGADERAVAGAKGVRVLLATEAIPADTTGAQIRSRQLVRQVTMPARSVPAGALGAIDKTLDNLVLSSPLQRDQVVMRGQFSKTIPTPTASPTFVLPPGKVAVSVDVGMAPQVAGNVDGGAKVVAYCSLRGKDGQWKTAVLIDQATVITAGERPAPSPTPTAAQPSPTPTATSTSAASLQRYVVTLAVSEAEGSDVANCYNAGKIHLGLVALPSSAATSGPVS